MPFTGEMLVLRKKPGSYDAKKDTEVWERLTEGVLSDPMTETGIKLQWII